MEERREARAQRPHGHGRTVHLLVCFCLGRRVKVVVDGGVRRLWYVYARPRVLALSHARYLKLYLSIFKEQTVSASPWKTMISKPRHCGV